MAPQRSASAPLPPFVRSSQKGVRVVRFRSAPCAHRLPCPHPSPRSQARCPPPLPVGALITLAIPSTMAIPSRVPTRPPLAPVRPCPYAGSGACSAGLLAAPRAAPGGFDYIYYTMETLIACPPPITPPTAIDFMLPSRYHLQKATQATPSADARSRGALLGSRNTAV